MFLRLFVSTCIHLVEIYTMVCFSKFLLNSTFSSCWQSRISHKECLYHKNWVERHSWPQAFSCIWYYQSFSFLLIWQIKNAISLLTCISLATWDLVTQMLVPSNLTVSLVVVNRTFLWLYFLVDYCTGKPMIFQIRPPLLPVLTVLSLLSW